VDACAETASARVVEVRDALVAAATQRAELLLGQIAAVAEAKRASLTADLASADDILRSAESVSLQVTEALRVLPDVDVLLHEPLLLEAVRGAAAAAEKAQGVSASVNGLIELRPVAETGPSVQYVPAVRAENGAAPPETVMSLQGIVAIVAAAFGVLYAP
jgi:hypothetical protein